MGMLASASIGDVKGFFETIHSSAQDIAEQNTTNLLAPILYSALMLDIAFGLQEEAKAVTDAVANTLKAGWRTGDIANATTAPDYILGTREMGSKVLEYLR